MKVSALGWRAKVETALLALITGMPVCGAVGPTPCAFEFRGY